MSDETVSLPSGQRPEMPAVVSRFVSELWSIDLLVYLAIILLGVLQFFLCRRASDFVAGDVTYYELARSLLERGSYGHNLRPETLLPPGFAVILAGIWVCFGNSYEIFQRSMAVFATLFLLATYGLLRRQVGRGPAAAICLLTGSSAIFFQFSTTLVFSDLPYAFTSTLALVVALQLDAATNRRSRTALSLFFGCLLTCSLMLRSAGIAILAGLAAWLTISVIARVPDSKLRLRTFAPLLAFGIAIQGLWMTWAGRHEKLQWPSIGGYPQSYKSQLMVKNGNYPQLGAAAPMDFAVRVEENAATRSAWLFSMLSRLPLPRLPLWRVEPVWYSPLIVGTVLLILLGLRYSSWVDSSGLVPWYFLFHEIMYLLWPWNLEDRFILPVAPLACMYLWRGGHGLYGLTRREPRKTGICILVASMLMLAYPLYLVIVQHRGIKLTGLWVLLVLWSVCITRLSGSRSPMLPLLTRRAVLRACAMSLVAALVAIGLVRQVRIGLENVNFDVRKSQFWADIESARWLASHTDPGAVVMARWEDPTQHYSGRNVAWFPPSSNPTTLMDGIRRLKVEWIVVVDRGEGGYWLPPDQQCFASLERTYPDAFHLVHQGPRNRIYKVDTGPRRTTPPSSDSKPPAAKT